MFTMYDSVDLSQVPNAPHAVAAYINGKDANYEEAKRRFPHARILRISVEGIVPADMYDVEKGDYNPEQVPDLYRCAKEHGIWRPGFYGQLSGVMPAIKNNLNKIAGLVREDVRLMVAYYNGTPDLPHGYDAHQFTDRALGRNLDESICADTFFQPIHPTPPAPHPAEIWKAELEVNLDNGEWKVQGVKA